MNAFQSAIRKRNRSRPPVWLMRQAGRYHSHYQALRKRHSFMDLCRKPEIACEATLGPIRDFDFDAAILFSDLLFPLEAMGMGLRYDEGPALDWHLLEAGDLRKLRSGRELAGELEFQAEAMRLIRKELPPEKGLLGFVGGPLTLYCYAVEGRHSGELSSARKGLVDGRFEGFADALSELLAENMILQARAGADAIAVMDTCAGEFQPPEYERFAVPALKTVLEKFHARCPEIPVIYYSKGTGPAHWEALASLPETAISGIGIDWRQDLRKTLENFGDRWAIQGNVDPEWLFLQPAELEKKLRQVFSNIKSLPVEQRQGWICGLGHGVLPKTPEENVRLFVRVQREVFAT